MSAFFVRRGTTWAAVALSLTMAACGGEDPTGPTVTTEVEIRDNQFDPGAIQVSPGATVTWTWAGVNTHNINFGDASITDATGRSSGTYSTPMPSTPGTYDYQCNFHPGMAGSVVVQ